MQKTSCCFIGHRKISVDNNFKKNLYKFIENLITEHQVYNFLFGSNSEFNNLCCRIVTELKAIYPFIVRTAHPCGSEAPLLEKDKKIFENAYFIATKNYVDFETYDNILDFNLKYVAGKASYIKRNQSLIDKSDICVFYFNENIKRTSGTKHTYNYAKKKNKQIYNLFNEQKK